MKNLNKIIFTIILLVMNTIVATADNKPAKEEEKVVALLKAYEKALNAGDTKTIVSLYTKDGIFYPTTFPTATGGDELEISYNNVFKMIKLTVVFDIEEVVVKGDYAFARTQSNGKTLIHANGQTVEEANRELFILKKVNDAWKIDRYMFNKSK